VFWAFLILGTVYVEAYGALFDPDFAIPMIGHWAVLGFLQDFIAVMCLVGLVDVRDHPAEATRRSGSAASPGSRARTSAAPGSCCS
jgi:hypothetical protein